MKDESSRTILDKVTKDSDILTMLAVYSDLVDLLLTQSNNNTDMYLKNIQDMEKKNDILSGMFKQASSKVDELRSKQDAIESFCQREGVAKTHLEDVKTKEQEMFALVNELKQVRRELQKCYASGLPTFPTPEQEDEEEMSGEDSASKRYIEHHFGKKL